MKKTVVDYRQFRLSKLTHPEYHHLMYLLGWVGYFILYFLTENLIPPSRCFPVYSPLDDLIPFCEYFIIFYAGWYLLIIGSLIYFALYNPDSFKNMMKYIITTQITAMIIYIVFPTRQDLRPTQFPRDNLFTDILRLIYSFDTSTNVCPSLHVAYSVGIASVWMKEKSVSKLCRILLVIFCAGVCVSVAFVKQHSVIDIFAAIPLCILAEWIAFQSYRKNRKNNAYSP